MEALAEFPIGGLVGGLLQRDERCLDSWSTEEGSLRRADTHLGQSIEDGSQCRPDVCDDLAATAPPSVNTPTEHTNGTYRPGQGAPDRERGRDVQGAQLLRSELTRQYGTGMRDADIRRGLVRVLQERFIGDPIRSELGLCLGETRVDLAVINCALHGYEIKSPRDNLARLPGQVRIYNRVLDFCWIVSGGKHLGMISDMLPPWWGVLDVAEIGGELTFGTVRAAAQNPEIDAFSVSQLVWRDEAAEILQRRGGKVLRKETRWQLWDRLALIPLRDLQAIVRETLKLRERWPSAEW